MSTIRDEIRQHLIEAIAEGVDHGNLDWKYDRPDADEYADAILALLRERLTSETAVEAGLAASYLTPPDVDWTVGERRCMSNALTAALDAITGETR